MKFPIPIEVVADVGNTVSLALMWGPSRAACMLAQPVLSLRGGPTQTRDDKGVQKGPVPQGPHGSSDQVSLRPGSHIFTDTRRTKGQLHYLLLASIAMSSSWNGNIY